MGDKKKINKQTTSCDSLYGNIHFIAPILNPNQHYIWGMPVNNSVILNFYIKDNFINKILMHAYLFLIFYFHSIFQKNEV